MEYALTCLEKQVDLEGSARYSRALIRRRVIRSARLLLKLVMVYGLTGYSLSMVGLWGTVMAWGSLSKNAVRKRLQHCQAWIGYLIVQLMLVGRLSIPDQAGGRVRLMDASLIRQPGSPKANWRLHLSFNLSRMRLDGVQLTPYAGGETLTRWQFEAGDVCLADRFYGVLRSLGVVWAASAYFVIRIGWQNLPMSDQTGCPFSVTDWLCVQSGDPAAQPAQTQVWVNTPQGRFPVRLIARAIPAEKAKQRRQVLRMEAKGQHRHLDERSLLAAGFVILVSNLPDVTWSASQILDLYRFRWQVELVFKRLKGLLDLDQIRVTRDPGLAQVFLLTKILVALALGELQWSLALAQAETFCDPDRPISLWRLTQLVTETFRQAMIGSLTWEAVQYHWPHLARYLCDPPRRRRSQLTHRPDFGTLFGL